MLKYLLTLTVLNAIVAALSRQVPLRSLDGARSRSAHHLIPSDVILQTLYSHGVDAGLLRGLKDVFFKGPSCEDACNLLGHHFPNKVITKTMKKQYQEFTGSYWSVQQTEVQPRCIFMPSNPYDVAAQILACRLTNCHFSVKGGGHASFAGASSVQDGITVSLEKFKEVVISKDRKVVAIGMGNRWGDVYERLKNENITVIGGRDADVGVGGYILGGGMSFFSNLHGWACDNVVQFEVVLGNGTVLLADQAQHADLYRALRGGGDNLGVVTRIWVDAYPLKDGIISVGGGGTVDQNKFAPLLTSFVDLATTGAEADGKANQILSFIRNIRNPSEDWETYASVSLVYTEGLPSSTLPRVFESYIRVLYGYSTEESTLVNTSRDGFFTNVTLDYMAVQGPKGQPPGRRNTYWTHTFTLSRQATQIAFDVFLGQTTRTGPLSSVSGLTAALMLQPITAPVLRNMKSRGGNSLGLDDGSPRLTATCIMSWDEAGDDDVVMEANRRLAEEWKREGREHGFADDFIYMNYAAQEQEVITGYGPTEKERLTRTAMAYDPELVFQKLVRGYHKLGLW